MSSRTAAGLNPSNGSQGYTARPGVSWLAGFVGMSRIRETSTFGGVPIAEQRHELRCGVAVIDMQRGTAVAYIEFKSGVEEIFAVEAVPEMFARPFISGPTPTDDDAAAVWMVPQSIAGVQTSLTPSPSASTTIETSSTTAKLPRTAEDWNERGWSVGWKPANTTRRAAAFRRAIELKPNLRSGLGQLGVFFTADRGPSGSRATNSTPKPIDTNPRHNFRLLRPRSCPPFSTASSTWPKYGSGSKKKSAG